MSISAYILENGKPVPTKDWAKVEKLLCDKMARIVRHETFGDVDVSTCFLCIDHNHTGDGDPVLWESMIFGGELDGEAQRYRSLEAAKEGHEEMVKRVLSMNA